jgi:hypothetical protein
MKFLRGYGRGRPLPEFALKGETPPALRRWYRASLRAMWAVFGVAAALALVLPAGLAPRGSVMRSYVDLMATVYPYIGWAERKSSSMPDVVAVWYALTAPAVLALFLARMAAYPWADLARVARTSMGSVKQHLLLIGGAWLLLAVGFGVLIHPSETLSVSPSIGHGKAMLYLSLNSRIGLAVLGPLFYLFLMVFVFCVIAATVGFVLRFTSTGGEGNNEHR